MTFFIKIMVNLFAFAIVGTLFKGIYIDGFFTLIAIAVLFGILNAFVKPFLALITIPITALTFGIFYLFINGFMVWLTSFLIPGFVIHNFATAFWAAIMLSITSWLLEMILIKHHE
ncbi:MAG: phage holin family protein [Candidatus Marinimicrobia bacterium]|nr:phage holin family protein [Candidatus Neomarinimicrobiota bacterium]